jgi:hypothetical protein
LPWQPEMPGAGQRLKTRILSTEYPCKTLKFLCIFCLHDLAETI